jgi:type IV pilus assembly protein PilQ
MTVENEKAEIIHGTQIPVVTPGTADRPPTVTYKDAALKLVVTPSVTSEETVFLDIEIANDVPDFRPGRAILGNVPIDKREAKNKVLVRNGETVVIGGILKTREDEGEDSVPGLSKIPILGWLFKKELKKTESQEMLIFITPRIVK